MFVISTRRWALALLLTAPAAIMLAADEKPAATVPASQAASQPTTMNATDKATAAKNVGMDVIVSAKVAEARWTSSGSILFINFEGNKRGDFVGIAKKENREALDKAFDGDIAKALTGKKVAITGKITTYKESPQIEVSKPEQVKIITE